MDKRFFLALLLTAAVVLVTPYLFPNPKRNQRPGARPDSAQLRADTTPRAGQRQPVVEAPIAADSVRAPAPPTATTVRPAARVETTTVAVNNATYGFSSLGASLVSAQMSGYRSLRRDAPAGSVELARPGEALVAYRLFTGR